MVRNPQGETFSTSTTYGVSPSDEEARASIRAVFFRIFSRGASKYSLGSVVRV
jgi:hypothetical protein